MTFARRSVTQCAASEYGALDHEAEPQDQNWRYILTDRPRSEYGKTDLKRCISYTRQVERVSSQVLVEPRIIRKQRKFGSRSTRLAVLTSQGHQLTKCPICQQDGPSKRCGVGCDHMAIRFTDDHQLASYIQMLRPVYLAGKRGIQCGDKAHWGVWGNKRADSEQNKPILLEQFG